MLKKKVQKFWKKNFVSLIFYFSDLFRKVKIIKNSSNFVFSIEILPRV